MFISRIGLRISLILPKFSIIVNGEATGFFNSRRGLRQGDPISPYLFIIMVEDLGRAIRQARTNGELEGIRSMREGEVITHHQFVDDTILIGQAKESEARQFKQILSLYERGSHQRVNLSKIKLFLLNSIMRKKRKLAAIIRCKWMNYNVNTSAYCYPQVGLKQSIGRIVWTR